MEGYRERARERFEQIKINYRINNPITEFKLKEGIKLQEEYRDIPIKETKRRSEVLRMADSLLMSVSKDFFKPIGEPNVAYIDWHKNGSEIVVIVYYLGEIYKFKDKNISNIVQLIYYLLNKQTIIYIDKNNFGIAICNELDKLNFKYKTLKFNKNF